MFLPNTNGVVQGFATAVAHSVNLWAFIIAISQIFYYGRKKRSSSLENSKISVITNLVNTAMEVLKTN